MKKLLAGLLVLGSFSSFATDFVELENLVNKDSGKVCICNENKENAKFGDIEDANNLVGTVVYSKVTQINKSVIIADCSIKNDRETVLRRCQKFSVIGNL